MEQESPTFSKFPELPKEIRSTIWELALTVPQIHIIREDRYNLKHSSHSLSRINIIMQTCKEAQEEGLRLKFPFLYLEINSQVPKIKNYINYEEDTLWIPHMFPLPRVFCSRCEPKPRNPVDFDWAPRRVQCGCLSKQRLGGVAINYDKSRTLIDFKHPLRMYNVKSFSIVVSKDLNGAQLMNLRGVELIEPTVHPFAMFRGNWTDHSRTWEVMAQQNMDGLRIRQADYNLAVANGIINPDEEHIFGFTSLDTWQIPTIRYMEALPVSGDCVRTLSEEMNDCHISQA